MKRREGFTLTELLVLVPVASLASVLLFASLDDAKQKLQASQCLNNMRQWGLAFEMYGNDYSDYLPWTGMFSPADAGFNLNAWFNVLPHYINQPALKDLYNSSPPNIPLPGRRSIHVCPSSPAIGYTPVSANPYFSYAMNRVMTGLNGRLYKRSIAALPGQVILLSESENNQYPFTDGFYIGVFSSEANQIPPGNAPRHFAGRNFVFVDGHAAWYATNDYSRTKAEASYDADIEWARPHAIYWYPCGDNDRCNKS